MDPNKFLSTSSFRFDDDDNEFRESLTQYTTNHYAHDDEAKYLRKKCENLQTSLDKSQDEARSLQLQLVTEKAQREQVVKDFEAEKEKIKMEFNNRLCSSNLDVEKWKQVANSTIREVELLQEQLRSVQTQKSEANKKLSEMRDEFSTVESHRRSIDGYLRRNQDSLADLNKQMQNLNQAKNELDLLVKAQREQISMFNIVMVSLDRDNKIKTDAINSLEKELLELKSKSGPRNSKY